ncbi:MAG: helix-turn-helix domain-containing protein [Xenophilus sp.]
MQLSAFHPHACPPSVRAAGAPRRRLSADVRAPLILDAALQVFAQKGFASARIDDIAQQAGLSKGGIYAHFKSKEDIFLALLERLLSPTVAPVVVADDEAVTVDLLIERVIDPGYAHMAKPESSLALRLLLADARNLQAHVQQWHERTVAPYAQNLEQLVRRGVREGTLRPSVVTQAPWFILMPNLHALLSPIIVGQAWHISLDEQRRIHVAMLRELLTP